MVVERTGDALYAISPSLSKWLPRGNCKETISKMLPFVQKRHHSLYARIVASSKVSNVTFVVVANSRTSLSFMPEY
jgi:hypothetical protein